MKTIVILFSAALLPALCEAQHADTTLHTDSARLHEIRILGKPPAIERKLDRVIIHVDALLANSGSNAMGVLENTPGVTVDDEGNITLNGKSGVLVLIDDRPTYLDGQALANYLKALPAGTLDQVELLTTPPARYQAAGSAGIIILRTKKNMAQGQKVQVTSAYTQGVAARWDNTLVWNANHDPWAFTGTIGYSGIGGYYQSRRYRTYFDTVHTVDQVIIEQSVQSYIPWSAALDHQGKLSWGIQAGGNSNPYHEHGTYVDTFYSKYAYPDSTTLVYSGLHSRSVDEAGNGHLLWAMPRPGRTLSADADFAYYQTIPSQYETSVTTPAESAPEPVFGLLTLQPFTAWIYSLKADYGDRFSREVTMEGGVQSTWSIRSSSGTYLTGEPGALGQDDSLNNTFAYKEQIRAGYLSLRREGKRLSVQAGVRVEATAGDGFLNSVRDSAIRIRYVNAFPSLHLSWTPDSSGLHQFFFSVARRINRPGYGELNPSPFFQDRYTYFTGNPLLRPEFTDNAELTYSYQHRLSLTARYSRTASPISTVYVTQGSSVFYYSANLQRETETGLDATLDLPLAKRWNAFAFAQWMYKTCVGILPDRGFLDKGMGYLSFSGNLHYNFSSGWDAEVSGIYNSASLFGESVLRPIGKVNVSLRKKLWKDRAMVTLTGNDLLATWINTRFIYIPGGLEHFRNDFYRRAAVLNFTFTLGKSAGARQHESGIESEKARLGGQ